MTPKVARDGMDALHKAMVMADPGSILRLEPPPPDPAIARHNELMLRLAEMQGLLVDILRTMQSVGPKPAEPMMLIPGNTNPDDWRDLIKKTNP